MVFRLNINTYKATAANVKSWLRKKFLTNLFIYKNGVNEIALNKYFLTNYKMSLINICLWLFDNGNIRLDTNDNIIILFEDRKLDDIAKLITYGNGRFQGSQILAWSLGRVN